MGEISKRSTRDERLTRLLDAGDLIHGEEPGPVLFAHTVFCQTGLPYRNPGDVREWERANGAARMEIIAGKGRGSESALFWVTQEPVAQSPLVTLKLCVVGVDGSGEPRFDHRSSTTRTKRWRIIFVNRNDVRSSCFRRT